MCRATAPDLPAVARSSLSSYAEASPAIDMPGEERTMTEFRRIAAMAACCLAVVLVAGCGSSGDDATSGASAGGGAKTLRIGFSAALSGDYAAYDTPVLDGMKFAAKKINAAGGDSGIKVEID